MLAKNRKFLLKIQAILQKILSLSKVKLRTLLTINALIAYLHYTKSSLNQQQHAQDNRTINLKNNARALVTRLNKLNRYLQMQELQYKTTSYMRLTEGNSATLIRTTLLLYITRSRSHYNNNSATQEPKQKILLQNLISRTATSKPLQQLTIYLRLKRSRTVNRLRSRRKAMRLLLTNQRNLIEIRSISQNQTLRGSQLQLLAYNYSITQTSKTLNIDCYPRLNTYLIIALYTMTPSLEQASFLVRELCVATSSITARIIYAKYTYRTNALSCISQALTTCSRLSKCNLLLTANATISTSSIA